jgi:type II secretory pathway component PulJ
LTWAGPAATLDAVSLADLLTALAVLGLVLSGTFTLLHHGQRTYAEDAARVEAQQSARVALDRMSREIRQAGRGDGLAGPAISVAEPTRIVLHVDLDGDGVAADRRETITWRLATGVLRRDAGGGAQPIVEGVRDFTLAYRDERGASTTDPAAVRSVRITLTMGADGAPESARLLTTTLTTEVRLRNR